MIGKKQYLHIIAHNIDCMMKQILLQIISLSCTKRLKLLLKYTINETTIQC